MPEHTASGVIPPFIGSPTNEARRAPWAASSAEIASRFGTSSERRTILDGLFRYRAELRKLPLLGFQWLDGSFLDRLAPEQEPHDVDVVTFYERPAGMCDDDLLALVAARPELFSPPAMKRDFSVDGYFVELAGDAEELVRLTTYWHGLFSHTRFGAWRGLVSLRLTGDDDDDGAQVIMTRLAEL